MTQSNTIVAKASVAFVAIAMSLMMIAPAKAATAEEMQAQIDALMATIKSLQAAMGTTPAATPTGAAYVFTRSLTIGSQGADVTALQTYLIAAGHPIAAGATGYFGAQTAAAVAAWQTANGISPAAGYFGPVSQAKYAALMAAAPTTPTTPTTPSTSDLQGEASLKTVQISNGDDRNNVEEGSSEMAVADIEVEFNDGDAMITRLDIALAGRNTPTEADPWKVFGDVSLMVDGDVVATVDASDKDNYLDEDSGSIRFTGLDIVSNEDDATVITVAVDVSDNVDNAGTDADWDIAVGSLRFVDAEDVVSTEEATGDQQALDGSYVGALAQFSIDQAGAGDDLNLEDSDENPDTATIELSENDNTEEAIFAFDISAEDSDTDITLDNLVSVRVSLAPASTTNGTNLDTIVNDFRLEIDGNSYAAESYTGSGNSATIDFDINGDETIASNEMVTAVLFADFNQMENVDQGSTIAASTTPSDIDAEGDASGETVTVDGSTVSGNVQTLRTAGVAVTYSDDTVTADENNDTITTDNAADFTLKFNVKSFGDSVYVPFGATTTTGLGDGVKYEIVNTNTNAVVATGTTTPGVTAAGGTTVVKTNSFKVSGSDVLFTLTVNYDPLTSGSYKLRLAKVNFASSDVALATTAQNVASQSIETAPITISQ